MVKLFCERIDDIEVSDHLKSLSKDRLSRIEEITDETAKKQAVGAELLLNKAVKAVCPNMETPVDYERDEFGKPYFKDGSLYFSISHSGSFAAVCVSDMPVGVDIEEKREYKAGLARRFFSIHEAVDVTLHPDRQHRFLSYWVMKESYMKKDGRGFHMGMKSFTVFPDGSVLKNNKKDENAKFTLFRVNDYYLCVCSDPAAGTVERV